MPDKTATPVATAGTLAAPAVMPVLPSPEEQAAAAQAAAAAMADARATGLSAVKSFVDTDQFKAVMEQLATLQGFMGGDPLVGAHLNCMLQGGKTLAISVATLS